MRRSYAVPPLKPDVTVVHAQRADAQGNTQMWGLLGCQKEAAFAAERVIVVVEQLVDEAVNPRGPEPDRHPRPHRGRGGGGAVGRPSLLRFRGAYDRDNRFHRDWDAIAREAAHHRGLARTRSRRQRAGRNTLRSCPGRKGRLAAALGYRAIRLGRLRSLRIEPRPRPGVGPGSPEATRLQQVRDEMIVGGPAPLSWRPAGLFRRCGAPDIAGNLARLPPSRRKLELVYESWGVRRQAGRGCPLSIGEPDHRYGATGPRFDVELFRLLPSGRGLGRRFSSGAPKFDRFGNQSTAP